MLFLIIFIVISAQVPNNEAFKVLIVFPLAGPSHNILGNGYVNSLLKAGHEVTYITPYPRHDSPPNYHEIIIDYPKEMLPDKFFTIDKILDKTLDPKDSSSMLPLFTASYNYFLKHKDVEHLISDPKQSFDVVIVEWLFFEVIAGFAAVFQAPLIWSSPSEVHWMVLRLIDEFPNPAYLPDIMSNNVPPFTFWQRLQELWKQISGTGVLWYMNTMGYELYDEVFVTAAKKKGINLPSLDEVKYNASLMISNSHYSLGEPVRLPQNFIPIAGYHIEPTPKPLPEDLQKLMDDAKDGVIYFSMGSNLKSKDLPEKIKKDFLEMFSKLKQTVLWKFEETLTGLPKNVHILKWAPQHSILAHPNCVLFITHGGLLSTTESVHFGVPIIGIPVAADQFVNVARAVNRGFALKIDLSYDTPKDLKPAIEEVLTNSSYREKVKYLSLIYHDRPVPPAKELVHWVEHTVKTRGAPHLRSRALMTAWYQKMYLDLAVLVLAVIYGLYFLVKKIFKRKKSVTNKKKLQ